ncbi:MAG: aldo/keto reductase [Oscillospiraceae bacterium]|jgi:predicted aldo/keto reductase-like oxidoreductase|nr:aldo/keto reductase [Oscillospiraceae bacterium]
MQYRVNPKNGDSISQLGLGCMRFPRKGGRIDQEKANELVAAAIACGVNYFDTAYIYPGSEVSLGKALAASGKRAEINIATKLPHFMCKKPEDIDRAWSEQLGRLQTDRIDYYLMHMLSNIEAWERMKSFGIERWVEKKRADGKIRNFGFSYHGGRASFVELLDAYDWDFCMVQYNYYDEYNQAGISGVREAHKRGLPVFVMEPLRGGMLANKLPDKARRAFSDADSERSPAQWALRWVLNHPEVTMALSGMSDLSQLAENSDVADSAEPNTLGEKDFSAYKNAVSIINGTVKIACTACGYCMPCPKGVDIPSCFSCYNESYSLGLFFGIRYYVQVAAMTSPNQSDASKCVSCGKCEAHCPQGIQISKELVKVRRRMKTFAVKPVMVLARRLMRVRGAGDN